MDYEGEIVRQLPWLRKMAYMYCRQDADMEDLVSDTVLKLLLAKDVFKEKHAFRSFAYSVMQHVFINKYNRKKCVAFVEQFPTAEPHASSTADATIRAKDIIQRTRKASAQSAAIPRETMERIAREVATPYKFGMVIAPEKGEKLDGPMVFRRNGRWYMMYVRFDGRGYATMLADSDDLLTWRKLGCILSRGKAGDWDSEQADGVPLLLDPEWEGSNELKSFNGKYWMLYIGGSRKGYEPDPLSTGVAFTDDPAAAREWTRAKAVPALSPSDADARPFERKTIYKHYVVEDASRSLGARFVDYYNAKQKGEWHERIGMAVSDDLVNWRRYGDKPVIDDCVPGRAGISGDPMIRRIGDVWVMFYFGYNWRPGEKGAFDTFACSRDLVNWTKWTGEPLLRTSEPYDRVHAHKPWVIKHDGVVYHFYCAVGDFGRGLSLATSRRISRP